LASISTLAAWGIELPTIVANPCHALSDSQSLLVAVVLHDFAQSGHQLLVVSERTTALARWRQLGVLPIDWQRTTTTPSETLRQPLAEPAVEVRTHVATTQFRPAVVSAEDEPRLLTSDGLERFPVFGPTTAATFAAIDLHTVGQLVEADCETVARRLNRDNVTPAIVALWQTHLGLLCFVPQIDLIDADLLVAAGIDHADVLADIDLDTLDSRIGQLLGSPRGERFARRGYRYSRATAKRWRDAARGSRQWRAEQADWQRWQQRGSERRRWLDPTSSNLDSRTTARSVARERSSRTASTRTARSSATKVVRQPAAATTRKSKYKFRLERSSNVVDAPSIGPKTAKRLAKVGVRTVSDLLAADPARLAEKLGTRHITPEVLVAWQHQAQLACRVPNLRALDTQLLVGCGFTTPEAIAHASASELHEFVKAFAATTEGKRYLREAPAPGIERVEEWIDLARHQRSLEAA
jgi:predicted flap endonuclease-1-like 5' DNA nuclease